MSRAAMRNAYLDKATAQRYDSARSLPPDAMTLWMDILRSSIPQSDIHTVMDLGCGTGRFTAALAETFGCNAIGIEPSAAMLEVAMSRPEAGVEWKQGSADSIPLDTHSIDLVFMSQVVHHLLDLPQAVSEIARVLTPRGYLVVRNGTREHNQELEWLQFFPEARRLEDERMLSAEEIEAGITREHFISMSRQTVRQEFAPSYAVYLEKISRRGLSSLIALSDDAFQTGIERFKDWVGHRPENTTVFEPVDLFIFRKKELSQR